MEVSGGLGSDAVLPTWPLCSKQLERESKSNLCSVPSLLESQKTCKTQKSQDNTTHKQIHLKKKKKSQVKPFQLIEFSLTHASQHTSHQDCLSSSFLFLHHLHKYHLSLSVFLFSLSQYMVINIDLSVLCPNTTYKGPKDQHRLGQHPQ